MNHSPVLSIAYVPTEQLRPDPRNARTHAKRQVQQIANSIQTFGFTNPVLIDCEGVIIAGHGRLLAAKVLALVPHHSDYDSLEVTG